MKKWLKEQAVAGAIVLGAMAIGWAVVVAGLGVMGWLLGLGFEGLF